MSISQRERGERLPCTGAHCAADVDAARMNFDRAHRSHLCRGSDEAERGRTRHRKQKYTLTVESPVPGCYLDLALREYRDDAGYALRCIADWPNDCVEPLRMRGKCLGEGLDRGIRDCRRVEALCLQEFFEEWATGDVSERLLACSLPRLCTLRESFAQYLSIHGGRHDRRRRRESGGNKPSDSSRAPSKRRTQGSQGAAWDALHVDPEQERSRRVPFATRTPRRAPASALPSRAARAHRRAASAAAWPPQFTAGRQRHSQP